jgi:hypothetical protein
MQHPARSSGLAVHFKKPALKIVPKRFFFARNPQSQACPFGDPHPFLLIHGARNEAIS